jgi:hypothetical protein
VVLAALPIGCAGMRIQAGALLRGIDPMESSSSLDQMMSSLGGEKDPSNATASHCGR